MIRQTVVCGGAVESFCEGRTERGEELGCSVLNHELELERAAYDINAALIRARGK